MSAPYSMNINVLYGPETPIVNGDILYPCLMYLVGVHCPEQAHSRHGYRDAIWGHTRLYMPEFDLQCWVEGCQTVFEGNETAYPHTGDNPEWNAFDRWWQHMVDDHFSRGHPASARVPMFRFAKWLWETGLLTEAQWRWCWQTYGPPPAPVSPYQTNDYTPAAERAPADRRGYAENTRTMFNRTAVSNNRHHTGRERHP